MCLARRLQNLLLPAFLLGLALPAQRAVPPAPAPVYPGAVWTSHADPRAVGYDPAGLKKVEARLRGMKTTGLMVVVGGQVLFQYGDVEKLSYLASVRKSVLAMLYGKYVAEGSLRLGATLQELGLDELDGLLPVERKATVEHLLTARSGIYHPASNGGDDTASAPPRGSQQPGQYFLYNNWDFNAAGAAFELMTKRDIYDALEQDLAQPLGMQDFDRKRQEKVGDLKRSRFLAYHMVLSTRDMARLGLLMLRQGAWEGRQVIPKEWAQGIVTMVTPPAKMNPDHWRDGPFGYGRMWWIGNDARWPVTMKGFYTGIGMYGQYITVLPALDMVIAHKTDPRQGSVGSGEYFDVVRALLAARIH
jgi:CubicO group peptidase (beta-lactamase class C family)